MKTHMGYTTKQGRGVKCSKCDEWIEVGEKAVYMEPAEIQESGKAKVEATAIHGVIHLSCFEEM